MKSTISVKAIRLIVLFILFTTHQLMGNQQRKCQFDNFLLIFTGDLKVEYGKLTKHYKCSANHSYWIVDKGIMDPSNNNNTNNSNNSSDRRSGFTPGTFDSGGALIRGFEAGQRIKNQRRMEKLMEEEAVAKMTPKERKVYYEYKRKKELERKEKRKKRRMLFGFALWIAWSFSTPIP